MQAPLSAATKGIGPRAMRSRLRFQRPRLRRGAPGFIQVDGLGEVESGGEVVAMAKNHAGLGLLGRPVHGLTQLPSSPRR